MKQLIKHFSMRLLFLFVVITTLASCQTSKQLNADTASIPGKYWKLVEIKGQPLIPSTQQNKEAYMILNATDKRMNGNSGCNSFFGSYEFQPNNGIMFSKIGATKMACAGNSMQVEQQLFNAFESAKKFSFKNNTLILSGSDMSPLAKFVVSAPK